MMFPSSSHKAFILSDAGHCLSSTTLMLKLNGRAWIVAEALEWPPWSNMFFNKYKKWQKKHTFFPFQMFGCLHEHVYHVLRVCVYVYVFVICICICIASHWFLKFMPRPMPMGMIHNDWLIDTLFRRKTMYTSIKTKQKLELPHSHTRLDSTWNLSRPSKGLSPPMATLPWISLPHSLGFT